MCKTIYSLDQTRELATVFKNTVQKSIAIYKTVKDTYNFNVLACVLLEGYEIIEILEYEAS